MFSGIKNVFSLAACAPGARMANAELFHALKFIHMDKNPSSDVDGLDEASFNMSAETVHADVSQARAGIRQRIKSLFDCCATHAYLRILFPFHSAMNRA
jgi:hypothetical protein